MSESVQARKIILASGSPRRRELLGLTGLKFRVALSDYEEDMTLPLPPQRLAKFLSCEKAAAVAGGYKNALVIAADTFILFNRSILGKPHTPREAARMLTLLSGRVHTVITGYTILDSSDGRRVTRAVSTKVYFRELTRREIDSYVATGEPLDKAGAYAIQGRGSLFIKKISGDYFNVIGLPLCSLTEDLKTFGIFLS
ncbi:MAG: septum formation inhibitor Maf [Nitrospirae bacterium]|nr:MAG: septum formation inhibitor Maf [Nitrospirota bacterium]